MFFLRSSNSLVAGLSLLSLTQGLSIPSESRSLSSRTTGCKHGPTSRHCWSDGFDLHTNHYQSWPDTGKTVEYDLHIQEKPCNPDGGPTKMCQLINGQYPGPVIRANWGDKVKITVHNECVENGTSIHWHGIRQVNSCEMDGTNGLTECPIAPHDSKTYEWTATQYGTTWYHSHHTAQYGQGIVGSIIIDGPATADYDEDLGVLPLTDWYYESIYSLLWKSLYSPGPPIPPDNVLVNGTMVDGKGNGKYQQINIKPGKKYRLRFVNTATDHLFHVSLDNHPFTVISADLVPIKPYTTTDLKINVGQRYDVIFEANQDAANYWLRLTSAKAPPGALAVPCGQAKIYKGNGTLPVAGAILSYAGAPKGLPSSSPYATDGSCNDEIIVPFEDDPYGSHAYGDQIDTLKIGGPAQGGIVHWFINGTTMDVDWENPTLGFVRDQKAFTPPMNVVEMPEKNKWYLWVVENALSPPIPHPIHLHGHDFEILGRGVGPFPWGQDISHLATPSRRDVATLPGGPGGGWMLMGIYTDNPGAWLMHCHIGWHAAQGFSMQFVERADEIISNIGSLDSMEQGCNTWRDYWNGPTRTGVDEDSGL